MSFPVFQRWRLVCLKPFLFFFKINLPLGCCRGSVSTTLQTQIYILRNVGSISSAVYKWETRRRRSSWLCMMHIIVVQWNTFNSKSCEFSEKINTPHNPEVTCFHTSDMYFPSTISSQCKKKKKTKKTFTFESSSLCTRPLIDSTERCKVDLLNSSQDEKSLFLTYKEKRYSWEMSTKSHTLTHKSTRTKPVQMFFRSELVRAEKRARGDSCQV